MIITYCSGDTSPDDGRCRTETICGEVIKGARRRWITSHGMEIGMVSGKREGAAPLSDVVRWLESPYIVEKRQHHTTEEAKQRWLHGRIVGKADLAALYTWKGT